MQYIHVHDKKSIDKSVGTPLTQVLRVFTIQNLSA